MRIVVFDSMRGSAVGECGVYRERSNGSPDDSGATCWRPSRHRLNHSLNALGRLLPRSAHGDSKIIQEEITRPVEDFAGEVLGPQPVEELY